MNLNKVIIVGRMAHDPELKTTQSGTSVCSFSVATSRVWTDKSGQKQEEAEFHNVVAWGKTAEVASQYLTKGQLVAIEGRLMTRKWEDKTGNTRYSTEIICERLQLGPKPAPKQTASHTPATRTATPAAAPATDAEEIPIVDIPEEGITADMLPF